MNNSAQGAAAATAAVGNGNSDNKAAFCLANDLTPMPDNHVLTNLDVVNGRGKRNWNHSGNVAFRNLIQSTTEAYMTAQLKSEKTAIVDKIVADMRAVGCRFLVQKSGKYYEMGDSRAREKVAHSLRDQVSAHARGKKDYINKAPKLVQQQDQQQGQVPPVAMMDSFPTNNDTVSDSGNEAEQRRSSLRSTAMFQEFARRPSWIAGENAASTNSQILEMAAAQIVADMEEELMEQQQTPDHQWDHNMMDYQGAIAEEGPSEEEEHSHNFHHLLKASIIQSWDPRASNLSAISTSTMRRSIFADVNAHHQPMRMSAGRTSLRRETLRMSDVSMMTADFLDGIDWSNSHTES